MDFSSLSSPKSKQFLKENAQVPIHELLLKASKFKDMDVPLLCAQLEGREKAKRKLPSWSKVEELIYPIKLSMEQCSSEATALYKASLVSGKSLIDLTGGFGVDALFMAGGMEEVTYVERNPTLVEIVALNAQVLGINNLIVVNDNSLNYLKMISKKVDWIYLDPARRKEGSKVFFLDDCEPNIIAEQDFLLEKAFSILLKTSPLLDIGSALKSLTHVKEVHIVAVENECKELLFLIDHSWIGPPKLVAASIQKDNSIATFQFSVQDEQAIRLVYGEVSNFLYEPNVAILKAGAFKSIALAMGVTKLHVNSHLYTSQQCVPAFPGRTFRVIKQLAYSKKLLLEELPDHKANVTCRNFPDSVDVFRKKTGIKDGGPLYLFATTNFHGKPIVVLAEKVPE